MRSNASGNLIACGTKPAPSSVPGASFAQVRVAREGADTR